MSYRDRRQKKLSRKRDQRRSLIKHLAEALVSQLRLETTLARAKVVIPYTEKLITKAKRGQLADRRLIISKLISPKTAHKLIDQIAPQLSHRQSGYLRMIQTRRRRGDNAQMALVDFVDQIQATKQPLEKPDQKSSDEK